VGLTDFDTSRPGRWPGVLGRLFAGAERLTHRRGALRLRRDPGGDATPAQIAAFVTALRMKGETIEEMAGFVRAMLDHAEPLGVPGDLVDTCGTGGDRSSSINVSTIAAFVVAGAGARVCKHGGRAATSVAGSADVLEALGVVIDLGPGRGGPLHRRGRYGFCFAPRFHPAMRFAGSPCAASSGCPPSSTSSARWPTRAGPAFQVVGVSDPAMAEKMIGVLAAQRQPPGHGRPRRRRSRRVVDHGTDRR
jgi:anthranilate phosphoribosyltransferase